MMKKKILMGLGIALVAVAALPMFSAFEAHVINVTAQIENALQVTTEHIDFGTVFPQEHLEQPLDIMLSRSFMEEERVDDVEYIIRQKPKCGVTTLDGTQLVEGSTHTGHVIVGDNPATPTTTETYWIDCGVDPNKDTDETNNYNPATHMYGVLPSLCEYISKEGEDRNDGTLPSFHKPWTLSTTTATSTIVWNDVRGRLAKSDADTIDRWIIDLAVPCFGGFCAQDWADFVHGINPDANPDEYTQPIENEHKVYGCDLWVEVTEVSEATSTQPEPATITVVKVIQPLVGTTTALFSISDFDFFVDATEVVVGAATLFAPGTYQVKEKNASSTALALSATFSGDCDLNGQMTLDPGENLICTITNAEVDASPNFDPGETIPPTL